MCAHLFKMPHGISHSPDRDVRVNDNLVYQACMHGEGIPKVERLISLLECPLQLMGKVWRGVDTQDLRLVRGVPPGEEGHLKPLVVLLPRRILRAVIVGFIVYFLDHLDQAAEPRRYVC